MKLIFIPYLLIISLLISCDKMFIDDLHEQELICSVPTDGEVFSSPDVFFEWNVLKDAEYYNIKVAKPSFDQIEAMVYDTNILANSFTGILLPGNYQWFVEASNHYSKTLSDTLSFSVDSAGSIINKLPHLLNPTRVYLNENNISFQWSAVSVAEKYRFDLKNGAWDEDKVLHSAILSETSISLELTQGTYSWGVQCKYKNQYSGYSYQNLIVDTIAPNSPILSEPKDETVINQNEVKLTWKTDTTGLAPVFDTVYIATNMTFKQGLIKTRSENSQLSKELEDGTYFWKVVSYDYAGNQSNSSKVNSFTKL